MPFVPAGKLRNRVILQEPIRANDGGQMVATWSAVAADVPAAIEPLRGREAIVAKQVQATTTHKITLRYRAGVTAKMRIVWSGRVFSIDAIANLEEANRVLEILATEVIE